MMHMRGVPVDLPEDGDPGVLLAERPHPSIGLERFVERYFRTRKYAHRAVGIIDGAEPASTGPPILGRELIADFRRARLDGLQTEVTNGSLLWLVWC